MSVHSHTLTAPEGLWGRLKDKARRHFFARSHVGDFLAMQLFSMRRDRGLTQTQLAELLGSTQPQVSEWEGSCETASLTSLQKIAEAFDVALSVKFVSFSELAKEAASVAADSAVPSYDEESAFALSIPTGPIRVGGGENRPAPRHSNNGEQRYYRVVPNAGTEQAAVTL